MDGKTNDTMNKRVLLTGILLLPMLMHAEHLIEAGAKFGLSGYDAQCTYVTPKSDIHAGLMLSYAYHSPFVAAFRAGVTAERHQVGFSKSNYTDSYTVTDVEGDPMQVDYTIGRLREDYTTWSIGFPLQVGVSYKHVNVYVGPKIVIPFSVSWKETAENASLSVYYPLQDNRVYESYPLAASRSFNEYQSGVHGNPVVQCWLSAELSYDIVLFTSRRYRSYLSIGIYADYSFTREKDAASDFISLLMLSDTRDGFPLHRMMVPVVSAFRQGERLVSSRKPFDVGIKVSYRLAPYDSTKKNAEFCRCIDAAF